MYCWGHPKAVTFKDQREAISRYDPAWKEKAVSGMGKTAQSKPPQLTLHWDDNFILLPAKALFLPDK